jgi:predicted MPP superfamily phosphohydrolase
MMEDRLSAAAIRHGVRARWRATLRHAAFTRLPVRLSRGRLTSLPSICDVQYIDRAVVVDDLPPAFAGLRITHLSDLHIGELIPPARLGAIIDAANERRGDLVAVTGDFVDLKLNVLDEVIAQLGRLRAPLGVFMVPGNHDYLMDGPRLVRRFHDAGLDLLINEHRVIVHRGARLVVGGIDYSHHAHRLTRFTRRAFDAAPRHDADTMRLLLAHHPHAFDPARDEQGVRLTLAGHTHGGQVVLAEGPRVGRLSLGAMNFRYAHGLYSRNGHHLHVTSGIGASFPWRYRCPAEIVSLTLHRPIRAV